MISIKLLCNFIEITLRRGCSLVNLLHIFKTLFCKNTSVELLLYKCDKWLAISKYHVNETWRAVSKISTSLRLKTARLTTKEFCYQYFFQQRNAKKSNNFNRKWNKWSIRSQICFVHVLYFPLTLSWRRPLPYRNQSIDLHSKSVDWFLYDNGLRHERVKKDLHIFKNGGVERVLERKGTVSYWEGENGLWHFLIHIHVPILIQTIVIEMLRQVSIMPGCYWIFFIT